MNSFDGDNLKKKLKSLKAEKGSASRAVGCARREDRPVEPLIAKVQEISREIKRLEAMLKKEKAVSIDKSAPSLNNLPSQFKLPTQEKSAIELSIVDNLPDEQWDEYVLQHPNASLYHHSAIRGVIEETFRHNSCYLAAIDPRSRVRGLLPLIEMRSRLFGHFLVSLPYFNYGGILADSFQAQSALLDAAAKRAQLLGARHIEYRQCFKLPGAMPTQSDKVSMLRDLPETGEQLWSELGTKIRAQVKKAERVGIQVKAGKEMLVDDFYKVFSRNMRDLGTPVYSKRLFLNMIRHWPETSLMVAYLDQRPLSAGLLLGWRDTIEIPWASTIREANRFDANMKFYWEALRHAVDLGYKTFDFGRSTRNASTFRFKNQRGSNPTGMIRLKT